MKKFALIGKNIENSPSPQIHSIIYRQLSERAEYTLMDLTPAEALNFGLDGFNVTRPYKEEAAKLTDLQTACGSVNTVTGDKKGYSTDGDGFILDAKRLDLDISKTLIYGTGGAARSILYSLNNNGIKAEICGRSYQKAQTLADIFNVAAKKTEQVKKESYSLVIDCTDSLSRIKTRCKAYYDIKYGTRAKKGCFNGLGMLIYQAILSEEIFLQRSVDKNAMFNVIYSLIGERI